MIYMYDVNLKPYSRALTAQDSSALARLPLFKLGWIIAKNNPLGVGGEYNLYTGSRKILF